MIYDNGLELRHKGSKKFKARDIWHTINKTVGFEDEEDYVASNALAASKEKRISVL